MKHLEELLASCVTKRSQALHDLSCLVDQGKALYQRMEADQQLLYRGDLDGVVSKTVFSILRASEGLNLPREDKLRKCFKALKYVQGRCRKRNARTCKRMEDLSLKLPISLKKGITSEELALMNSAGHDLGKLVKQLQKNLAKSCQLERNLQHMQRGARTCGAASAGPSSSLSDSSCEAASSGWGSADEDSD